MFIGAIVWAFLVFAYAGKWIWARAAALAEFRHPIQCCYIGLVPVSSMLVALAATPYSPALGEVLFTLGAVGQLAFGIHRTGATAKSTHRLAAVNGWTGRPAAHL